MLLRRSAEVKNVSTEPIKQIFISYAMQDSAKLSSVIEKLQQESQAKQQIRIIDSAQELPMGEDLRQYIRRRIQESDEVAVVWTKASAGSSFVNYEAAMADALDKPVVVVVADQNAPELPENLQEFSSLQLAEDN
jgi:hypothetical protein